MGKLREIVRDLIFLETVPLYVRLLNMICLVGVGATVVSAVTRVFAGQSPVIIYILSGVVLLIFGLLYMVNALKMHKFGVVVTLLTLCNVLFPLALFTLGGAEGGMAAYFALSITIIFLLSWSTRMRVCMLGLHTLLILGCYIVIDRCPHLVITLGHGQQVFDNAQSALISGFFIGFVTFFQQQLYLMEKEKSDTSTEELIRQSELMRIVNEAAVLLLNDEVSRYKNTVKKSMGMLGKALNVDRVSLWKNEARDGKTAYVRLMGWNLKAFSYPSRHMEVLSDSAFSRWRERLPSGMSINGPIKSFSRSEHDRLAHYGVRSILVIPVMLQGAFWGFVTFEDCRVERVFTGAEERCMRSGSMLLVSALVRGVAEERLVAAREEAIAGAKTKSAFLANMSHEIRTPMNAIVGMTAIGQKSADIGQKDVCLKKIEDASSHLLDIINDILDMSKIHAGKLELSAVVFSFDKLTRRAASIVRHKTEEKRQNLTVDVDAAIPPLLEGDDRRLLQVMLNLLSNAVKFTPDGGNINLSVRLAGMEENLCTVQIAVSDTGVGMNEEQRIRVFDAFEQADNNTTRRFGGTGLGLAISRNIAEMMGGGIRVDSEPDKGSTFVFTARFPVVSRETSPDVPDGEEAEQVCRYAGRRILLVEDMEINRDIVLALLEPTGLEIDCAENGAEAVRMFSSNAGRYDMIFMDMQMPVMDGCEAARRIRASGEPDAGTIPIVAMTANVLKEDIDKCLEAGMNDHVGKPLDLNVVLEKLRRYLPERAHD
ncbi:MAG: response regulator [Desulfovibrio sp.]|jgi:signal transduction histidine kinase/CheY-like chemotaxis protein|nr:response regulator [Desulfovibrio sp.]